MPLVSVVMPAFNAGTSIVRAVRSILDQTFADLEIVVVDDGSEDNTSNQVEALKDPRIRLLRLETNSGIAVALNHAILNSSGQIIARMDADDWASPTRLSKQCSLIGSSPQVGVLGAQMRTSTPGSIQWNMPLSHEGIKTRLIFGTPMHHPTVVFDRHRLPESSLVYDPSTVPAEDYWLWARLIVEHQVRFANHPESLLLYSSKPIDWTFPDENGVGHGSAASLFVAGKLGLITSSEEESLFLVLCATTQARRVDFADLLDFSNLLRKRILEIGWSNVSTVDNELRHRWYCVGKAGFRIGFHRQASGLSARNASLLALYQAGRVAQLLRTNPAARKLYGNVQRTWSRAEQRSVE